MPSRPKKPPPSAPIATLARSWELSLKAEHKSPRTIEQYLEGVRLFDRYADANELPTTAREVERRHVEAFIADILARQSAKTALARFNAMRMFLKWCEDEGEVAENPMAKMKPPTVAEKPVPVVTDDEMRRLLKACAGGSFEDRRDLAIISLLADTGIRRAECVGLRVEDVDLDARLAWVIGKGRRPRAVPFGAKVARALDRYLRVRGQHARADSPALWLGSAGRTFSADGLRQMLERRGRQADVADLHAHRFRHTFAHEHLAAGGHEGDLMMLTGWRSRQMLSRYASSVAAERARDNYQSPLDRL